MAKKFAQHFLINRHAVERIVASLDLLEGDRVLEIGPGKGALTTLLVQNAAQVTAIEVDLEMTDFLSRKFASSGKLRVVHADILESDFDSLFPEGTVKVVGNLPYNLTSPILRKLSGWRRWPIAVFTVQKEVGDRLCAAPGSPDYGALTVGMSLTCRMELLFELSETSFKPPPRVKSAVVKLTRLERPLTDDIDKVQRVIQAAFQQRRKTVLNSLSHGLGLPKESVERILKEAGVSPTDRPEILPVDRFIRLADLLPKSSVASR